MCSSYGTANPIASRRSPFWRSGPNPVSYTHLDVYKRQTYRIAHGGNKTPAGTFTLSGDRERWHEFPDGGFVQFATRYHNRLYVHSPLYGEENNGYMWPKYYDGELGIGKSSTGGCLRMVTEAARFIYENCPEDVYKRQPPCQAGSDRRSWR